MLEAGQAIHCMREVWFVCLFDRGAPGKRKRSHLEGGEVGGLSGVLFGLLADGG
jgi:hypothetical protein